MSLILTADTIPGTATWSTDPDGRVMVTARRVTLADLEGVASTGLGVNFPQPLPVGSIVLGASFRLDAAPAGGSVTSLTVTLQRSAPAPGGTFLAATQLVGAALGYPNTLAAAGTLLANGAVGAVGVSILPQLTLSSDVNLNLLTTFDVTGFIYFTTPTQFDAVV